MSQLLNFVFGIEESVRKEFVWNYIQEKAGNQHRVMLLVPEQISFQTERECYQKLGPSVSRHVTVLSFTRLAHLIFKTYGGLAGTYADSVAKNVVMELALQEVKDGLRLYQASVKKDGFSQLMLQTVEELKNSSITPSIFENAAAQLSPGTLRDKSQDIAMVYAAYDSILNRSYKDPLDDLARSLKRVQNTDFFSQYTIVIQDFFSFTSAQLNLVQLMMKQTDLLVSLCWQREESDLFEPCHRTFLKLKQIARELGLIVGKPIQLQQKIYHQEFAFLERNLLRTSTEVFSGHSERIQVILAQNEYLEIDEVLSKVWELVKSGFRFRDIVLVTRDLPSYRNLLKSAMKKYQIPYFIDEKLPASQYALVRLVLGLLETAESALDSDSLLSTLKTDMTDYSLTDLAQFENYLYLWGLSGKRLLEPFRQNPRGFVEQSRVTEQDNLLLQRLEQMRMEITQAIQVLRIKEGTAAEFGQALIVSMGQLGVSRKVESLLQEFLRQDQFNPARELERIWNLVMGLLETLSRTAGEHRLNLHQYFNLFRHAVDSSDMGDIPQSLDCVTVGSTDRMIPQGTKAVFVFGVNEGVFPFEPQFDGMFTEMDRELLEQQGIQLSRSMEERILDERLRAYQVLCSATEHLLVSARLADISGDVKMPSHVITQLCETFGQGIVKTETDDFLHLCHTKESSFLQLAFHSHQKDGTVQAFRQYFLDREDCRPMMEQLISASHPKPFRITEPENVKRLFGSHPMISPTQIENYSKCGFLFFCANGMKAYPRVRADWNPLSLGTVVHAVMERLLKHLDFSEWPRERLREEIHSILEQLLADFLGGETDKTARFLQLYHKLEYRLLQLADHVQKEFSLSHFRPVAFELPIGEQSSVKPLTISVPGRGSIQLIGTVDRVDCYQKGGISYLRVVDYKSGSGKSFVLSELYYGINMQMLIYLFSLWENGDGLFENPSPAGILYLPSTGTLDSFVLNQRSEGQIEYQKKVEAGFGMNGLLIKDLELIEAMEPIEPGKKGIFLPVALAKEDDETEEIFQPMSLEILVSKQEMEQIRDFVKQELQRLCTQLFDGEVNAVPLQGFSANHTACDWCPYGSICGWDPAKPARRVEKMNKDDFLRRIEEEKDEA